MKTKKQNKLFENFKKYSKFIFCIYMVVLIFVIVLKLPTTLVTDTFRLWMNGKSVERLKPQLIPFKTIIFYISQVQAVHDWFFKNLAANIVMFIPYGLLSPVFVKRDRNVFLKILVTGCLLSVFIEIVQYVFAIGQCDIDDVILNVLGVLIGLLGYKFLYKIIKKA